MRTKENGNIALLLVIVLMGILLVSGVVIALMAADIAVTSKGLMTSVRLNGTVRTCLEETLFTLKSQPHYTDQVSYAHNQESCTAEITNDEILPGVKHVVIDAMVDDATMQQAFSIDVTTEPFQVIE